jgi:hypothetical protein
MKARPRGCVPCCVRWPRPRESSAVGCAVDWGWPRCGSRCRAGGRRPASWPVSPVCAAFCAAVHGVGGIRNPPCAPGWSHEPGPALTDSKRWHERGAGDWGKAVSTRRWVQIPPSVCSHTHTSVTSLLHKYHKIQPLERILPPLLDTNTTLVNTGSTLVCTKSVSYVCHACRRTSRRWCGRGTVCQRRCKRGLWRWSRRHKRHKRILGDLY